ncbi:MAG: hypothetical protein NVSMB27_00700 [Ktedonobacteraceae bacterium]
MADIIDGTQLQPQPQPQPAPRTGVQEGFCVNRGALASLGFLAGWLPVNCCSIGLVPAILSGLGVGSAYFAAGNTLLFGLGWTPIWGLVSIAIVLIASYFMVRPAFAHYSRDVAIRSYWKTAGLMGLAAGITFILWTELVMPILFTLGVPMGALFK